MKHLSIKQIFVVLTIITLVMAALTLMSLLRVSADQTRVNNANNARYHSYLLADELRQSSDDLTRLARTYVVTGETRYEKQYNDILAIRNGAKARPEHYERIYWDLLAGGVVPQFSSSQAISLLQLMQQAGFSEQEFAKLKEAQDVSDALVKTEIIAMNAVKGWFDDGQGGFTRKAEPDTDMARRIMHDATYHRNKARIMVPLNEFLALLDQRTSNAVSEATQSERTAMMEAMALMILSILITILALYKVYDHIIRNLNQAISAAACIADGDLSREIKVDVKHEVGQLMEAIATINRNLHGMLSNIRSSTETMAVATQEIASGNTDLSSRTESQASSLEESASAMTALTHTVQQNATSAQDANELAVHASAVAGKGGEAMQAVIHTMAEIKGSSAKISDIIAVIDSIAFQTNILALNAAVEAARAGEQGRGFAVVATEVRALAQRSKEAAQEITILIGDSVKRVERGSRLVDEAGLTMSDITDAVHRVSSILTSIAHASKEQGAGIAEVNMAVGQMEGITQQNAALVEQAAAAAESLREQAQTLLKTVSIFKLSHTARTRSVRMLS